MGNGSLAGEKSWKELKEKNGLTSSAAWEEGSLFRADGSPQDLAPPACEDLGQSSVVTVEEGDGPVIADLAVVARLVVGNHRARIEIGGQALGAADCGEEGGKERGSSRGTPPPHLTRDTIRPRGLGRREALEGGG